MTTTHDAIVIGTGQSGPPLAGRMHEEGLRVAVVERAQVGGSCVNFGCIPTKTLVASARAAHVVRRAGELGVAVDGEVRVDMRRVKERMREVSGASNRGLTKWLEGMERVELVRGHARFVGPREVEVDGRRLSAERVFLNVGARARVPELAGLDEVDWLSSTGLLALDELPEHLVVVGGSYVGLEFAQMYRRFGSRVTVVEKGPRLISRDDPDVSEAVREILEDEGIEVRTGSECIAVRSHEQGVAVRAACEDGEHDVVGTHLLVAVGRVPNTDTLDLERAGVETDERGYVTVDDELRTSASGVWALGDCNGKGAFTHTSYDDYEIVAANLFGDGGRKLSDRIPCYGLFVDPPLGRVGMTEAEARATARRVLVGKLPMERVGRAKERGETKGFLKVLVDAESERILGAAFLGIEGDEAVHVLLDLMLAKAPYTVAARAMHVHPTVCELIPTLLQDLEPLGPDGG